MSPEINGLIYELILVKITGSIEIRNNKMSVHGTWSALEKYGDQNI
jgi:hypothetical protein